MLHADLANPESIGDLAKSLLSEGKLDGLVNNAGAIDFRKWDDFSVAEWRKVFAVRTVQTGTSPERWSLIGIVAAGVLVMLAVRVVVRPEFFQTPRECASK
jgi:NAD(P)-dependent dehydrogenase (short-subunit alcohol dehydrogenase family)